MVLIYHRLAQSQAAFQQSQPVWPSPRFDLATTRLDVELTKSSLAEPELKSTIPSNMIVPRSAHKLEWVVQWKRDIL